jgi:DnaD/phage-associated family protein
MFEKTVLAKVDGWTPVIDGMIPEVGATTALVFGKAWRYCQMSDGVCKASQERLAAELGMTRTTIHAHLKKLVKTGYLKDLTPDLVGAPHEYADTGKANLSIILAGSSQPVKNLDTPCIKSIHPPVKNLDTKKVLRKKKETINSSVVFSHYENNIAMLVPSSRDELGELLDTYSEDWIIEAMDIAVKNNVRKLSYIRGVLGRWERNGKQDPKKPTEPAFTNGAFHA